MHGAFRYHEKLILLKETFRSVPAQWSLDPVSEAYGVFSTKNLTSTYRGSQGQQQKAEYSMKPKDSPDHQLKEGFSGMVLRIVIGGLGLSQRTLLIAQR